MTGRDQVTLSAQERQSLAHLEERVRRHDPDFASRMRGRSWRWLRHTVSELALPVMPAWLGPVLVVLGLVATLLVLSVAPWLSLLTVGFTVMGAHRIARSMRSRIEGQDLPEGQ